jgi:hypothetical protein
MSLLAYALAQSDTAAADAASSTSVAPGLVSDVTTAFNHVNWAAPSWDVFIIAFFVVAVFLYGLSLGRDRLIVILVSIYMALAVVANAPAMARLEGNFALKAVSFIGIFLLLFFLVSRTSLGKVFSNLAAGKLWQVLLFSILQVGLLVSITLSFLPPESAGALHPLTRTIFATDMARFVWVVSPIAAMVFFTGDA